MMYLESTDPTRPTLGTMRVTRPLFATIDEIIEILDDLYQTGLVDGSLIRLGASEREFSLLQGVNHLCRLTRTDSKVGEHTIVTYLFLPRVACGRADEMRSLLQCLRHAPLAEVVDLTIGSLRVNAVAYGANWKLLEEKNNATV